MLINISDCTEAEIVFDNNCVFARPYCIVGGVKFFYPKDIKIGTKRKYGYELNCRWRLATKDLGASDELVDNMERVFEKRALDGMKNKFEGSTPDPGFIDF